MDTIKVNNNIYHVIKLLGKGKGGYSYLVELNNHKYTLKQIHHEPCNYFNFGNKLEKELIDYQKLLSLDILIPLIIEVDYEKEIIVKDFIDGYTINELIIQNIDISKYMDIVKGYLNRLYENKLNLDYYPTNFIVQDSQLYYIDYELNEYFDEWNFDNWGIKYWTKSEEFINNFMKNKES